MSAQVTELSGIRQVYSSVTERPADLSAEETRAYVRGYGRGCMTYARKYGIPSVSTVSTGAEDEPLNRDAHRAAVAALDVAALHAVTRQHEEDRHPTAHRAGMSALRAYRKRYGIPAPVATPAPGKALRKPRKLASVPTEPAPVTEPEVSTEPKKRVSTEPAPVVPVVVPTEPMPATYAARKAWRRELAATMRAAGIDPRGQAWADALAAAPQ